MGELERQRLQAEASAPPDDGDTAGPASNLPFGEPSAPFLEQASEGDPERSPTTPRVEEDTVPTAASTSNEPRRSSHERSGVGVHTHSDGTKESNITTRTIVLSWSSGVREAKLLLRSDRRWRFFWFGLVNDTTTYIRRSRSVVWSVLLVLECHLA